MRTRSIRLAYPPSFSSTIIIHLEQSLIQTDPPPGIEILFTLRGDKQRTPNNPSHIVTSSDQVKQVSPKNNPHFQSTHAKPQNKRNQPQSNVPHSYSSRSSIYRQVVSRALRIVGGWWEGWKGRLKPRLKNSQSFENTIEEPRATAENCLARGTSTRRATRSLLCICTPFPLSKG